MNRWGVHNCARDPDCDVARWHFNTPYGSLIVALDRASWTQAWLPMLGYTGWWWPIVWHPAPAMPDKESLSEDECCLPENCPKQPEWNGRTVSWAGSGDEHACCLCLP